LYKENVDKVTSYGHVDSDFSVLTTHYIETSFDLNVRCDVLRLYELRYEW